MTGRNSLPYDGFISYSHAADGRLAPALQRGLQRLAKPWNSRRALNIFRDETGLSTNPHLWGAIESALAAVGGNRREAAARLGIGLRTLYAKLRRYDVP